MEGEQGYLPGCEPEDDPARVGKGAPRYRLEMETPLGWMLLRYIRGCRLALTTAQAWSAKGKKVRVVNKDGGIVDTFWLRMTMPKHDREQPLHEGDD